MSRPAPCPRRCPRSKERPRRLPRPCGACSSSIPLLTQTSVTGCPSRQSSHLAFPGETSDFAPPPHDGFALFDSFRDLLSSAWGLRLSRVAHSGPLSGRRRLVSPPMPPIRVSARTGAPEETDAEPRVIGLFEGDSLAEGALQALVDSGEASSKSGKVAVAHEGGKRVLIVG